MIPFASVIGSGWCLYIFYNPVLQSIYISSIIIIIIIIIIVIIIIIIIINVIVINWGGTGQKPREFASNARANHFTTKRVPEEKNKYRLTK